MENEENCEPEPTERESKYHSADYKCLNCTQTDCCYWTLYNKYYILEEDAENE